jgi:chromate transporter
MMLSTCAVLLTPVYVWAQVGVITVAAVFGAVYFKATDVAKRDPLPIQMRRSVGFVWMSMFFALLIILPLLSVSYSNQTLTLISSFYSAGSLVFGGGHVVLPLLQSQVVPTGWLSNESFLAGYGLTQAMPGPLFTFAAYLGASSTLPPNGWMGGLICLLAIFAPSFFLVMGAMPFWETIRHNSRVQAALMSVNASVVGILLSALYHPVWTSSVLRPTDFAMALIAFIALISWKVSPWKVVCATAAISPLVSRVL